MLTEKDKGIILELARSYGVGKVYVFGSAADPQREGRDIDLGVAGIEPRRFFAFYGDLLLRLSKPVDLVDVSKETRFNSIVRREGVALYG